jgi:hypothetical protein
MHRSILVGLVCLVLATQVLAAPRRCGDNADGRGHSVPCDCGDVLVGDRTLGPEDPITQHVCDGTGLVVDVRGDASPVLALAGHTLQGVGRGVGIQVRSGGSGGLTVTGPGAVRGFATGLQAQNGALAAATDLLAADNTGNGFQVIGIGYTVARCEAVRNGGEGFVLRGRDYHADGNRALENGRTGFALSGRNAKVGDGSGNEAAGNGGDGIAIRGRDHDVERVTATANRRRGLRAHASHSRIAGATAVGNRRQGIRAGGTGLSVVATETSENGGNDLGLRSPKPRRCHGEDCR